MKVRFEIEVDEKIMSMSSCPLTTDEMFRDATGKSFLLQDPITKAFAFVYCERGITEDSKYAQFTSFPLPTNAEIVGESAETDADPLDEIKKCFDKHADIMRNEIMGYLNATLDTIQDWFKSTGKLTGEGISENTLLEVLRIVTRTKEE